MQRESPRRLALGGSRMLGLTLRLSGCFLGSYLIFALFLDRPQGLSVRHALCHTTASLTCGVLHLMGKEAHATGNLIVTNFSPSVGIVLGCTGFLSMLFFNSFVLASPGNRWWKIPGIVVGCTLILLFNLLRVVVYIFVAASNPTLNHTLHDYVYNTLHILLNIGLCVFWMEKVVRPCIMQESSSVDPRPGEIDNAARANV